MLTIEKLRAFGANVDEGVARCMNNEGFYLRMVNMAIDDRGSFEKLYAAAEADDRKACFEAAHALKGMLGNVALTPLFEPASELTELLRADRDADCRAYSGTIRELHEKLLALRDEA